MQSTVALSPGSYLTLHIETPEAECPLAIEVSIVRWSKNNQFGIEFLRYAQGDRKQVIDLIESSNAPTVLDQSVETESTFSTVTA
jgi:hypothetical protein